MFFNKEIYTKSIVLILGLSMLGSGILFCMQENIQKSTEKQADDSVDSVYAAAWNHDPEKVKASIKSNPLGINYINQSEGCCVGQGGLCRICHKKINGFTALDLALDGYLSYKHRGDKQGIKVAFSYLKVAKILIDNGALCNKWYEKEIEYHRIEYGNGFMLDFPSYETYMFSSTILINNIINGTENI